jgi:ParB family chromosome partitioning protein
MKAIEIDPTNLQMQVEGFTNFDRELTPGKAAKAIMADKGQGSSDLWKVKPQDIYVMPGYNPRVQNRAFFEGIEVLAENMAKHGYMQDKPLSVYSAKLDGEDRLVLQDGHRRLAAVMRAIEMGAPIKVVPVVLKERTENAVDLTLALLHSNEGQPFSTYEKAVLAKRLKKFGWTNAQIATEFRCTTAFVGQLLTLAGAPQAIAELVQNGNMSATEAHRLMMEHGAEEAAEVATKAVAAKKAAGKDGKITAKDIKPADVKAKRARKHSYDLFRLLKKYRLIAAVEKHIEDRDIEAIDSMIADIEAVPKVKEPKAPKPPKAAAAKKAPAKKSGTPIAKKIADAAAKGNGIKVKGEKPSGGKAFFDQLAQQEADRKAAKASAKAAPTRQRRSER